MRLEKPFETVLLDFSVKTRVRKLSDDEIYALTLKKERKALNNEVYYYLMLRNDFGGCLIYENTSEN